MVRGFRLWTPAVVEVRVVDGRHAVGLRSGADAAVVDQLRAAVDDRRASREADVVAAVVGEGRADFDVLTELGRARSAATWVPVAWMVAATFGDRAAAVVRTDRGDGAAAVEDDPRNRGRSWVRPA